MSKKAADGKGGKKDAGPKAPALPTEDEEGFSNFVTQDNTTNITLVVEGKKLFVHKDVLNVNCPGLRNHLNQTLGEEDDLEQQQLSPRSTVGGTGSGPAEVPVENVSYEAMLQLMKCIYPPHKPISQENVDLLLPLIGDYEVNTLKTTCEEVLLERELSVKLLLQAQQSQLERVCDIVAEKLSSEFSLAEMKKQEEFEQLNFANQSKLYRNRIIHMEAEKAKLDDTAGLLYTLTKCIVPVHKCMSVDDNRFGYLVITTTGDDGRKKRETFSDSALIYHHEINPSCKDCLLAYGQESLKEITDLDRQGAFDHVKKKFENEKKSKPKGGKK